MNSKVVLIGLAVLIAGGATYWYLTTPIDAPPSLLANKNEPADFLAIPKEYDRISPTLFRKRLDASSLTGDDKMRFEKVTDSGIDFKNYFDRNKPFELLDTGSGVAIGDYDNDGLQDVYLVGGDIPNKLYRNLGNFKFKDVTESAGVSGKFKSRNLLGSGATFADVDNDGDLDLYVCNMASPNLLYINQGDGTFLEQAFFRNVAYSGASKIANFCDYDQDGDLDFYLVTYQDRYPDKSVDPKVVIDGKTQIREDMRDQFALVNDLVVKAGQLDILYENQGDGTFEDVTNTAGVVDYGTTLAAVWFDYNNDGWQDIYASNDFHSPDRLYKNNRDGTFTDVLPEVVRHTPWFSMGNDAGDLNNDGLEDLMTADMSGTSHYKRKVDMGDMGESAFFLSYGRPRQYMRNCLYINSGAGPFFEMAAINGMSSTDWTWSLRFADLDNDGLLDVFATNGHARDMMNADIADKYAELGKKGNQDELNKFYCEIPAKKEANLAFKNNGNLAFSSVGPQWNLDHVGVSHGAAFADLDQDGDLDLIVNNYYEQSLIYRNQSESGSRVSFEFRCQDNNFFGVGTKVEVWQGDAYQSRTLRSARGYLSSDPPVLHFGFASPAILNKVKVTWPDNTVEVIEDLEPNNVLYRIIESDERQPFVMPESPPTKFVDVTSQMKADFTHKERPYDDFARENLLPYKLSEQGAGLAWGDVNGDSFPDLFCGGAAGQAGVLFINEAGKSFKKMTGPWDSDAQCEDMGMIFFDADGDGDDDLYVVSGSNECEPGDSVLKDRLYLNDGTGTFETSPAGSLPDVTDSGSCVVTVDFDRDGDLDLFVGSRAVPGKYPVTPISRLLQNDHGKFSDVTESAAPDLVEVGLVNSAIWTDYDNDGWSDLFVALDWGTVTVFQNSEGKLANVTSRLGLAEHKGWWHGITSADLDNDGDLDFVVTNQGQNSKYHTDFEHPHRMYYSDFDNSGTLDLVETEFEDGVEYPARGLSCSSNSMPFIRQKFETYHEFATASLSEIYEPSIREKPFREVNFLDSAILWNEGGKKFEVQALPRMAQVSPAFGVTVSDFNGDSHLDIFTANNFFASQAETGFMDGGLSLLIAGQGDRQFSPVWPNESGIALNVASYGAAGADLDGDGDLDLAVSANNDRMRLLENKSNAQGAIKICLTGDTKNSRAIGAQVLLTGTGFQRRMEITGGGSYLSQSSSDALVLNQKTAALIDRIEVVWPDGSKTDQKFQPDKNGRISIQKPD